MLGVGLRKLCPQDSFGYAFRRKKTVRKSTPGGCKSGPWGVQNGLREASGRLFCASWANLAAKAARKPSLGGSGGAPGALLAAREAVLKPLGPLLGRPGPLLGASWGWFWDLPGADLDDLDDVCGAPRHTTKNNVFYNVFGLRGPPGAVEWERSRRGPGQQEFPVRRPVRRLLAGQTIGLEARIVLQGCDARGGLPLGCQV